MDPIYLNVDHYVEYLGARDSADDAPLNTGTCTYALYTSAGVAVPSGSGTCDYLVASDGIYRGVIASTVTATLTPDAPYYLNVTFVQGNYDDARRLWYRAKHRGAL